mmetsp:Transcript_87458/g.245513  ORF Transcript_87458/g.245513 Transcript_87458/m.245513 type:complete len:371 (+) Transcript_87458:1072-2184(+)
MAAGSSTLTGVVGDSPHAEPMGRPKPAKKESSLSFKSASASSSHGESWPVPNAGDATPELITEASAEFRDCTPTKLGVSTPNPGVPEVLATAASAPRFRHNFIFTPCASIESRCSLRMVSKSGAAGVGASSRRHMIGRDLLRSCEFPMDLGSTPSLAPRLGALGKAELSRGVPGGVGCGDTSAQRGGGSLRRGWRTCCKAFKRSSSLILSEFRDQRAHVSSNLRDDNDTSTLGHGEGVAMSPQALLSASDSLSYWARQARAASALRPTAGAMSRRDSAHVGAAKASCVAEPPRPAARGPSPAEAWRGHSGKSLPVAMWSEPHVDPAPGDPSRAVHGDVAVEMDLGLLPLAGSAYAVASVVPLPASKQSPT